MTNGVPSLKGLLLDFVLIPPHLRAGLTSGSLRDFCVRSRDWDSERVFVAGFRRDPTLAPRTRERGAPTHRDRMKEARSAAELFLLDEAGDSGEAGERQGDGAGFGSGRCAAGIKGCTVEKVIARLVSSGWIVGIARGPRTIRRQSEIEFEEGVTLADKTAHKRGYAAETIEQAETIKAN